VGKTRLIAEWQAALDAAAPPNGRFHWIVGHSRSYGQGMPYHLLASAVQDLLDVPETADDATLHAAVAHLAAALFPADTAADVATYLAHLLSLPLDAALQEKVDRLEPQALQTRYRQALRRLLAALAARRPLALVLEDLHWADPSSADLLTDLLPLLADAPILFCLVTRPEQDAPGWRLVTAARHTLGSSLAELSLGALTADDSRELIANLLQIEALPDDVRQLILQKTEGNPFFVEEVIRMLIERQAIVRENGGWTAVHPIHAVDIPDNLQGLLMARIDRLPDEVRQTLRVAAVIGRQFPLKVLARVLGESTHDAAQ
ncbi:MAG: AAA family ATPase, partial [Anaerolineales bacterium]|nr:AAA family ATPase [Anaerolineales bacterium]